MYYLHGGLKTVDGHDADPPQAGGEGGRSGADGDGEVVLLEVGVHAGVGRGVAEPRERTLEERGADSAVETENAALFVQCPVKDLVLFRERSNRDVRVLTLRLLWWMFRNGTGSSWLFASTSEYSTAQNNMAG